MSEISGEAQSSGYDSGVVLGGVLATIFFPLIALIAALILQGNQPDPVKRGQLRSWAWVSGAWLAVGVLIGLVIFLVIVSTAFHAIHP